VRVALTQARGRLEGLATEIEALGHHVVRAPLIATVPLADDDDAASARALLGLPWRLYASRSAVEAWRALGLAYGDGARIGAVGPGTRRSLEADGARDVLIAAPATALGLARTVSAATTERGAVGIVQGRRARPALAEALRAAGFDVRIATIYETLPRPWPDGVAVDAVVLASPSAVAALPGAVGEGALLVAIGPTTLRAVQARGWQARMAESPTADAVAAVLRPVAGPRPTTMRSERR
jgi:uroporphyrinogen-III synthase